MEKMRAQIEKKLEIRKLESLSNQPRGDENDL